MGNTQQADIQPNTNTDAPLGRVDDLAEWAGRILDPAILQRIRTEQDRLLFNGAHGGELTSTLELADGITYKVTDLYAEVPLGELFWSDQLDGRDGVARIDAVANVVTVVLEEGQ